ncbi:MAG: DNA polymerase III subunit delta [Novosphingobium sp.]
MKATQREFASLAPRAAGSARLFFFCGADEAGAQDAAARIVALLPDAGERVELSAAELKKDPVRLGDEARSTSLFGGARHIVLRVQGDEASNAVETLLQGEVDPCPVLIIATGATDKSRTAKLLAGRPDALVAIFHPPDLPVVAAAVRRMADSAGLRIDTDIAERIARAASLDTRLAQAEVAKLALYLDASAERPRSVDPAMLEAISARTEEDGFAPLVNAVLGGATARLPDELRRMAELGLNPVGVLLACERRAAQLTALAARLGSSRDARSLIDAEAAAKRIFWKDKGDVLHQLQLWRGRPLERLVAKLVGLHSHMLSDSQNAELLLAHGLAEVARVAAKRS